MNKNALLFTFRISDLQNVLCVLIYCGKATKIGALNTISHREL